MYYEDDVDMNIEDQHTSNLHKEEDTAYYTAWDSWGINIVIGVMQVMIYLVMLPILSLSKEVIIPTDVTIKILIGIQITMVAITTLRVKGYYTSNILKIWASHFLSLVGIVVISYFVVIMNNKINIRNYGIIQFTVEVCNILGSGVILRFLIILFSKMFMEMVVHTILFIVNILDERTVKDYKVKSQRSRGKLERDSLKAPTHGNINTLKESKVYEDYSNIHTTYVGEWME